MFVVYIKLDYIVVNKLSSKIYYRYQLYGFFFIVKKYVSKLVRIGINVQSVIFYKKYLFGKTFIYTAVCI
jgi:hypothetical protein